MCEHDVIHTEIEVRHVRFEGSPVRALVIEGKCMVCGEPIKFLGLRCEDIDDETPAMTPSRMTSRIPFTVGRAA